MVLCSESWEVSYSIREVFIPRVLIRVLYYVGVSPSAYVFGTYLRGVRE